MKIHVINEKGSSTSSRPSSLNQGDMLTINHTSGQKMEFIIPEKGTYYFKAYGANGSGSLPGIGDMVEGRLNAEKGQVVEVVAWSAGTGGGSGGAGSSGHSGTMGTGSPGSKGSSGGGATLIYLDKLLVMAAGGGGGQGGKGGSAYNHRNSESVVGGQGGRGGNAKESGGNGSIGAQDRYKRTSAGLAGVGGGQSNALGGGRASNGTRGVYGERGLTIYDGAGGAGGGGGYSTNPGDYFNGSGGGGGGGKGGESYINSEYFSVEMSEESSGEIQAMSATDGGGGVEVIVEQMPVNKYLFKDGEEIKKYQAGVKRVKPIAMHPVGKTEFIKWDPTYMSATSGEALQKINGEILINVRVVSDFDHKIPYMLEFDEAYAITSLTGVDPYSIQGSIDNTTYEDVVFPSEVPYRFYKFNIASGGSVGDYAYNRALEEQIFECQSNEWHALGAVSETKELFDLHGMSDLSIITNEAIQQLQSDQVELLCWTDEDGEKSFKFVEPASNVKTANGQINTFNMSQEDYYHSIVSITKGSAS